MARYKHYDYGQTKLLAVSFERQILPGSFEYTLSKVIDEHIDLSVFEAQYRNDETGAPAYDPALLLKIILYAYSKGVTSSRQIDSYVATTSCSWRCRRTPRRTSPQLPISSAGNRTRLSRCFATCCWCAMSRA